MKSLRSIHKLSKKKSRLTDGCWHSSTGGLLGTLIPLGPGIVALGQGDTVTLSESMNVAFDTTIAGVISAAVASVISHIRKRWYNDDMVSLETLMEAVLEEVTSDVEG